MRRKNTIAKTRIDRKLLRPGTLARRYGAKKNVFFRAEDSRDLIGGLFEAMNRPTKTADDRYHGVDYFNGGLFAEPARLELRIDEVSLLKAASKEDWSKVRPEIFGTLFQHSLGQKERHAYGAHFTHPTDIMKIVGPTIVEPWRKQIEEAATLKRLRDLWQRMQVYTVLDPACGSGNFLYIAYRELKRLEARLFERMTELSGKYDPSQALFGFVSARQFFGLDINPFAVELAKVTMMIARKLAIDELHITERALPLDNLDDNFNAADALIDELGNPVQWPQADVIIGNPPFLGAKLLKPERGSDYVNAVRRAYPEVPGMADYCVYWFRKAKIIFGPVLSKIQSQAAQDWLEPRTFATINPVSADSTTSFRQGQSSRPSIINHGLGRQTSMFRSRIGSRHETTSCFRVCENYGSRLRPTSGRGRLALAEAVLRRKSMRSMFKSETILAQAFQCKPT